MPPFQFVGANDENENARLFNRYWKLQVGPSDPAAQPLLGLHVYGHVCRHVRVDAWCVDTCVGVCIRMCVGVRGHACGHVRRRVRSHVSKMLARLFSGRRKLLFSFYDQ